MGTGVAATSRARRTHSWLWAAIAAAAVLVAVVAVVTWPAWRSTSPTVAGTSPSSALDARTIDTGAVTVNVEPRQLDGAGAVFAVSFDTHSVPLDMDVTNAARLVVGTTSWPVAGWSGDGAGGHHRKGNLTFTAAGPATGTATLTIDGLPKPVTVTWTVGA